MNRIALLFAAALTLSPASPLRAQADLTDVEMAHAAVTANDTDIAYAHLALAISENPAIREFAETFDPAPWTPPIEAPGVNPIPAPSSARHRPGRTRGWPRRPGVRRG